MATRSSILDDLRESPFSDKGVVTRLETNSFTLKALAMTLAAAVLAFSGSFKNPNWVYPLAGCFPVLIFWIMDAKYLRMGRLLGIIKHLGEICHRFLERSLNLLCFV